MYFYKNEVGSRVYFDKVGPPWPKHPCIDIPFFTRASAELQGPPVAPSLRSPLARGSKTSGNQPQHLDDRTHPGSGHEYLAFTVQGSEAGTDKTILHLRLASEKGGVRLCDVSGTIVPEPGQLVFVSETSISYFDVKRMSVIQFSATLVAEPAPVPTPPRKDSVPAQPKDAAPTPLTLRKDSIPSPPRKDTASAGVKKDGEVRVEADPQESAGCGFSLLLFFLIILLWLVFGFWPGSHSFFGVVGGLVMSLITALGFTLGFIMLVSAKKEAAQDMRPAPRERPQHLRGTPADLRNSYSLFREE